MMSDWANVVIAASAFLAFIVTLIGAGIAYGAFKGRATAVTENAREATKRMFARINDTDARLERLEVQSQEMREAMIRADIIPAGSPPSQFPIRRRSSSPTQGD